MKDRVSPQISFVIPSLASRIDYLLEALHSLEPCIGGHDSIFVSLNGGSQEALLARDAISSSPRISSLRITFLQTAKLIPALSHVFFISRCLLRLIPPGSYLYFLADDDLMGPPANVHAYLQACLGQSQHSVGIGRFRSFEQVGGVSRVVSSNLRPGESITPLEFLARNRRLGHVATSMSSMLVPLSVFAEAMQYMYICGSAGRRFEYILTSHRDVDCLVSPVEVTALIRSHPGQEHKVLRYSSLLFDELVYLFWVWRQQPRTRPWHQGASAYGISPLQGFKILLLLLLLDPLLLLGNLWSLPARHRQMVADHLET